jgi:hypothetical protein
MKQAFSLIALVAAMPAFAEDTRELDAHEHGVGALNIAIDDTTVAMEFHAPGADIVGFEYAAESDTDLAAIEAAVATLSAPLELFVLPDAAACALTEAQAELESEEDHDEHDDHSDEDHAEHAEEAGHTEFHAEYALTCDNPDALTEITFAYFETFPNAQEVDVQIITASGAQAFEVERHAPVLDLGR